MLVVTYHEAELAGLVERVAEAIERYRAGEIDVHDVEQAVVEVACIDAEDADLVAVRRGHVEPRLPVLAMPRPYAACVQPCLRPERVPR